MLYYTIVANFDMTMNNDGKKISIQSIDLKKKNLEGYSS